MDSLLVNAQDALCFTFAVFHRFQITDQVPAGILENISWLVNDQSVVFINVGSVAAYLVKCIPLTVNSEVLEGSALNLKQRVLLLRQVLVCCFSIWKALLYVTFHGRDC